MPPCWCGGARQGSSLLFWSHFSKAPRRDAAIPAGRDTRQHTRLIGGSVVANHNEGVFNHPLRHHCCHHCHVKRTCHSPPARCTRVDPWDPPWSCLPPTCGGCCCCQAPSRHEAVHYRKAAHQPCLSAQHEHTSGTCRKVGVCGRGGRGWGQRQGKVEVMGLICGQVSK